MKIVREDFDGYYILSAVDDRGRLIWRRDGSARMADSREHEMPESVVRAATGARPLHYSSKGIV